jgi:multidrug efflux pump subunit AcrA (membrane-fusion protein)
MKVHLLAAASSLALCALLSASPVTAQTYRTPTGDRVDANGMPTTHSTPAEQAQTAEINDQVAANNAAADAQAQAGDAQYQAQQQNYQSQQQGYESQKQQYQQQLDRNAAQQQRYQNRSAMYEALRERYAAERAAYHRGIWPERYSRWVLVHEDPVGERVELISGSRVGTVIDAAHAPSGNVTALLVRLDDDKVVWIDSADIRYNRADGVVMTNLDRNDLHHMADERL